MKYMKNKAFTLIELIVVMAVIGVLVLLSIPKFIGHTQKAKLTQYINDASELEKASERYYMDKNEWPRLEDEHYTAGEIAEFSQKVYDNTGVVINLDPEGKYYDIDYDKLSKYVKIQSNKEHYIIQNPIGDIFYLDGLTERGKDRITNKNISVTGITLNKTSTSIFINETETLIANILPSNSTNKNIVWTSSNEAIARVDSTGLVTGISAGTVTITATTEDGNYQATCNITINAKITGMLGRSLPAGSTATASSVWNGNVPQNAVDGNISSAWRTDTTSGWIQFVFPSSEHIKKIQLRTNEGTQTHTIYGLKDGVWTQIGSFTINNPSTNGAYTSSQFDLIEGDYDGIKINMKSISNRWLIINEITIE